MKTSILILSSFVVIYILGNISTSEVFAYPIEGEGGGSLLPTLLNFIILCFVLLIIMTLLTFRALGKRFTSQNKIVRKNLNLKGQYLIIAFWYLSITVFEFIRTKGLGISGNNSFYYITVLATILIYAVIIKNRIMQIKPDALAIENSDILSPKLFGYKRQKMERLQEVAFNSKNNFVNLRFKDGLENIELALSDYEINDIDEFIEKIRKLKGDSLIIDESYLNNFPKTHMHLARNMSGCGEGE